MLELRNVTKTVGAAEHIRDVSLTLQHGSLNVVRPVHDNLSHELLPASALQTVAKASSYAAAVS